MKLMLLTVVSLFAQMAFAGSSQSTLTANVAEEDTGKGYVYVSPNDEKPAESEINDGHWWTTSSYPQATTDGTGATHYYTISGLPAEGYKFVGVKRLIEEGVYGDIVNADENNQCHVSIECVNTTNFAIYYAVWESISTGIQTMQVIGDNKRSYDLNGMLVDERAKGIIIRNGKKYTNK